MNTDEMEKAREDIDEYIRYSKIIFAKIMNTFMSVEIKADDPIQSVMDTIDKLPLTAVIQDTYLNVHEPYYQWLQHDCPFTGHKGVNKPLDSPKHRLE